MKMAAMNAQQMNNHVLSALEEILGNKTAQEKVACTNEKLVDDSAITSILEEIERQVRPPKRYINDHGPSHARMVLYFGTQLYRCIVRTPKKPLVELSINDVTLSVQATLAACYLHDIGRWAKEKHALIGLTMIDDLLKPVLTQKWTGDEINKCCLKVKQWIETHDDLDAHCESVEEAIVKLADKLHCTRDRIYKNENGEDYPLDVVIKNDPQPWEYFGAQAVQDVAVEVGTGDVPIEIHITVDDIARAVAPLKTVYKCFKSIADSRLGFDRICRILVDTKQVR